MTATTAAAAAAAATSNVELRWDVGGQKRLTLISDDYVQHRPQGAARAAGFV